MFSVQELFFCILADYTNAELILAFDHHHSSSGFLTCQSNVYNHCSNLISGASEVKLSRSVVWADISRACRGRPLLEFDHPVDQLLKDDDGARLTLRHTWSQCASQCPAN